MHKLLSVFLYLLVITGCGTHTPRIMYINSYHQGYPSSDSVMAGIAHVLDSAGVAWETVFMDSKRHPEEAGLRRKSDEITGLAVRRPPDILIASDDDAVKYLIAPHYKDGPMPAVFCGVNWRCEQYGLPTSHVTGMLEVLPLEDAVALVRRYYPDAHRLTVLTEHSTSSRGDVEHLTPVFHAMHVEPAIVLAETFDKWQAAFLRANAESDMIFIPTNGAVRGWSNDEARNFVQEHLKVPVFTCDDFMMDYAVMGVTKVAREQGEWAARTALEIIRGRRPADIPLARNSRTIVYWNRDLAERMGLQPDRLTAYREWN